MHRRGRLLLAVLLVCSLCFHAARCSPNEVWVQSSYVDPSNCTASNCTEDGQAFLCKTIACAVEVAERNNIHLVVLKANETFAADNFKFFDNLTLRADADLTSEAVLAPSSSDTRAFSLSSSAVIEGNGRLNISGFRGTHNGMVTNVGPGQSLVLDNVVISGNIAETAEAEGGAFSVVQGTFMATSCSFVSNSIATNGLGGALYVQRGNATLSSCSFSSNFANKGGAICGESAILNVSSCSFASNFAAHGGAVYGKFGTITLLSCDFTSNNAAASGGAVYGKEITLTLLSCNLTANSAVNEDGGAVYSENGVMTISSCIFTLNYGGGDTFAEGGGGAVYVKSGSATLSSCTLTANTADSCGGALCVVGNPDSVTVTSTTLTSNSAYDGGALCGIDSTISFSSCILSSNTALRGGATYLFDGTATFSSCNVTSNTATISGGAFHGVAAWFNTQLTLASCIVSANSATTNGGGVYADGASVDVWSTSMASNYAPSGGAFFGTNAASFDVSASDMTSNAAFQGGVYHGELLSNMALSSCNLKSNSASFGGVLFASGGSVLMSSTNLHSNSAFQGGVAMGVRQALFTVTSCSISRNSAVVQGGAFLLLSNSQAVLSSCDVSANAGDIGGAFYANSATVSLVSCNVSENSAGTGGGAFYGEHGAAVSLSSCEAVSNSAPDGGVFYATTSTAVTLAWCNITSNSASNGGAVYAVGGGSVTATSCMVSANSATMGGSVYASQAWVVGHSSRFLDNAAEGGGAVWISHGSLAMTACRFVGNRASTNGGALFGQNCSISLSNNTLSGNVAGEAGGGVFATDVAHVSDVHSNFFIGNSADRGAGMAFGTAVLFNARNITLEENMQGGGLYFVAGSVVTTDTAVIRDNVGHGIFCDGGVRIGGASNTIDNSNTMGAYSSDCMALPCDCPFDVSWTCHVSRNISWNHERDSAFSARCACTLGYANTSDACNATVCTGSPLAPGNGSVDLPTIFRHGTVARFSCNEGFTLVGSPTLTCNAPSSDMPWPAYTGTCQATTCTGAPAPPANGTISLPATVVHGSQAVLSCDIGFKVVGSPTVTCAAASSDQPWPAGIGDCQRAVCTNPPLPPSNGSVTFTNGNYAGSRAIFSCDDGFIPSFSNITCAAFTADQPWPGVTGSCQEPAAITTNTVTSEAAEVELELPLVIALVIIFVAVLVVAGSSKYLARDSNVLIVFAVGFVLFDVIGDIFFVASLAGDDRFPTIFALSLTCLALSSVANVAAALLFFGSEIRNSPSFAKYFKESIPVVSAIVLLASTNLEALNLMTSGLYGMDMFKAPVNEKYVYYISGAALVSTIIEDIPQLCFQIYVASNASFNLVTGLAFAGSALTVLYAGCSRLLSLLVVKMFQKDNDGVNKKGTDADDAEIALDPVA